MSEESNNPTGTAALTPEQADSKIAAILFNTEESGEPVTSPDSVVEPSNDGDETREEHPENPDSEGEERSSEDAGSQDSSEFTLREDAEYLVKGEKIKGKDLELGYMRQSDYTRKTQELAQQREQIQGQLRNEYGNHLRNIEQNLIDHFPQEPNWMELAQDNPAEYAVQREQWNKRLADLNGVRHLRAQQEHMAKAELAQAKAQAQTKAFEDLVQLHPEFALTSDGKMSPVSAEVIGFATQEVGLPEELLSEVDDARIFSILYDAMRYRRQEAQKSRTVNELANKPGLTKPGVTQSKTTAAQADLQKQRALLKRTGDAKHADSLIAGILFNNK
ncbi:UNVERIFIED_ORG: hypothetical protein M2438_002492 [Methylobacterium sp. SuP10 SLI 274]|uniref:hypothetical protein n=1 Tax=Methylorubrum extorquens TaxID=408 RepID=UPI00209D77AC|nr:hypothetical protein [Methylorubrum extorquens]MDF9863716.1 hypothetical protein [Methylorubrum pseudosasae]MDH6637317.1 hypothetical protein [Methylobacterium sp. SuP10 SLI 274]MDH6666496.1 hypothetical protein [Methylorubrum zatmanii]MCP1558408.1 hypothetical protein [Methylorubrum extorquens]MDF9792026.1 hypothetical protein [Methylorubrum extorquens]